MYIIDLRPEVNGAIMATIESFLATYPLDSHAIEVEPDDFGGEGIFIHLNYNKSVQTFDANVSMEMTSRVRSLLIELGDYRFPFIRHHFHPRQQSRT